MKLDKVVFALVLALWVVVILIMMTPEAENVSGMAHPQFDTMRAGGDAARHDGTLWLGWAFGSLIIGIFVALMSMGAQKAGQERGATIPIFATGIFVVGLWSWMVRTYAATAGEASPDLVLSFPPATSILVYTLWPLPAIFGLLFVFGFKRWVLSDEDHEAFEKMMAETAATRGEVD